MSRWTVTDLPDQSERTFLVTGATSGLGLEAAVALARAGATVLLTARDPARGARALERVREVARTPAWLLALDLASLASVEALAAQLLTEGRPLSGLLNNAGIMAVPRGRTADGVELQLGTNHLGHFALTVQLWPLLVAGRARVVNVTSDMHRVGRMHWDDLEGERRYGRYRQYNQSKVANLLFTLALVPRGEPVGVVPVAAHPGYSHTGLQQTGGPLERWLLNGVMGTLMQRPATEGVRPLLRALLDPDLAPGTLVGPGLSAMPGPRFPVPERAAAHARRPADAERLWAWSVERSGVDLPGA